jgi:hypothetical protein
MMRLFPVPAPQHCFCFIKQEAKFRGKNLTKFAKFCIFSNTKFREINRKISQNTKYIISFREISSTTLATMQRSTHIHAEILHQLCRTGYISLVTEFGPRLSTERVPHLCLPSTRILNCRTENMNFKIQLVVDKRVVFSCLKHDFAVSIDSTAVQLWQDHVFNRIICRRLAIGHRRKKPVFS